jgi:hypothetical protein
MSEAEPADLTAVLLPAGQLDLAAVREAVRARGYGDVILRVAPLAPAGLEQIEVHRAADGLPCEDPELVALLSRGGRAAFVHVNHSAKQAIVHAFVDGRPLEGFAGAPGPEFEAKLDEALGRAYADIIAADDGTRLGIGVTSSHTAALVGERVLALPPRLPSDLDCFSFHDGGDGMDRPGSRLVFCAFDPEAVARFRATPGRELAARLATIAPARLGPFAAARDEAAATLSALGDQTPETARLADLHALEAAVLAEACLWTGGDRARYWDERVLPLFGLGDDKPVFGEDDLEELEGADSVLHAMLEVLPFAAPPGGEGTLLHSIGDDELAPLSPWAAPGEEYAGSLFVLSPARLAERSAAFGRQSFPERVERFFLAWYRAARPGQPEGDAYKTFRQAVIEHGHADVDRCLRHVAELRFVLEVARHNRLSVGLLFYEGA